MITQKDLKNKLKSVSVTGKLADAVESISAAKYYRAIRAYTSFMPYAKTVEELAKRVTDPYAGKNTAGKRCYVVLTSNRGLCGGYNSQLYNFFADKTVSEKYPLLVVCGKKGIEHFKTASVKVDRTFVFSDIPPYSQSLELSEYLLKLYSTGEASEVVFVYQKFKNLLVQNPFSERLLPLKGEDTEEADCFFYPGRAEVENILYEKYIKSKIHYIMLEWSSGVQAATMTAMRTSAENAKNLKAELELTLNRRRQASVTSRVAETTHIENHNETNQTEGRV